jgi:enoyl-CoA hydratase
VRSELDDRVVTVTLDSPANRNALSRQLVTELDAALTEAVEDKSVHAVLLTHTGTTFCSGAALNEMLEGDTDRNTRELLALFRRLLTLPIPVVARVDGAARAGGLGILGSCDVVLAASRSTFAFTEVRLGLAPAVISLPLRPLLDPRAMSRYFITAETFDAATAQAIGLISEAADDVDTLVPGVLEALRKAERQGLRETRALTTADRLRALDDEGTAMAELSARLFASPVAQAHFSAFLDQNRKGRS